METSDVIAAARSRMETQWALGTYAAVPLRWANEPDDQPPEPFVAIIFQFGNPRTVAWGQTNKTLYTQSGEMIFRCFGKSADSDNGESAARLMAEAAAVIFRGWRYSGQLRFYRAAPTGSGALNGEFYEIDAIAFFEFDTVS